MTALVTEKLKGLAATIADLKVRVREALASELSKAVAGAVGEVVHALVGGRQPPRPVIDPYSRPAADRWSEKAERWEDSHDDSWADDEPYSDQPPRRTTVEPPPQAQRLPAAVKAGVSVTRWWLSRQGTLLAAAGAGIAVGLVGLFGGPVARIAVAVVAATAELFSVANGLGDGAAHLIDF